jgi:hypothetical protein
MVGPLASGVTELRLVSFPGFMRLPRFERLGPAVVVFGAVASASLLFMVSPLSRAVVQADCSASSPCPTPTPTPTLAFLSFDVTSGDQNTQITVNGGAFLPNEQMTLYWDQPSKVAGGANADSSGNFTTHVKPFSGDAPGVHRLCASVPPTPCANFTLTALTPSPSPSPSPSPEASPSPSPTPSATPTPSPTPVATSLNGFDVISKPPLVFLPIAGALAILLSLGYWVWSVVRRPRALKIPATAVVHRATRPDYSAGFGTPPATTASPGRPELSAWADVLPGAPTATTPPTPEPPEAPAAEPPPAAEPEPPAASSEASEPPSAQAPEPHDAAAPGTPDVDWNLPPPQDAPAGPDDPLDFPEPAD